MPEIIPLGWFHTVMGIIALVSGAYTLFRYKEILLETKSGKIYLITTLITAATALAIFQHGSFGPAHMLAVLTLLALAVGLIAATIKPFGIFSRYLQALGFTSTLLFHCIPAVTDALLRLPVGDPFLTSIEDPIMKRSYLVLVVLYLIGISLQLLWIRKQSKAAS